MKQYVAFGRIPQSEKCPVVRWVATPRFISPMPFPLHVVAMTHMPSHDNIREQIDLIEVYELPASPVCSKTIAEWEAESK